MGENPKQLQPYRSLTNLPSVQSTLPFPKWCLLLIKHIEGSWGSHKFHDLPESCVFCDLSYIKRSLAIFSNLTIVSFPSERVFQF